MSFSCRLPAGQTITENNCIFYSPDGGILFVNKTGVYNDEHPSNGTIPGLEPHLVDSDSCGIKIPKIEEKYFGKWKCILNQGNEKIPEHGGDFTILTKEELFVRDVRLPRHVIPSQYDLHLTPFIEEQNFTTSGYLELKFKVSDSKSVGDYEDIFTKIFLHAKDIAINEATVTVKTVKEKTVIPVKGHEYDFERDFYIVHLKQQMPLDEDLVLEIRFKSYLNDYLVIK